MVKPFPCGSVFFTVAQGGCKDSKKWGNCLVFACIFVDDNISCDVINITFAPQVDRYEWNSRYSG